MNGNIATKLNYIRNPFYTEHLKKVRDAVYKKVVAFDIYIAETDEPVEYGERLDLNYRKIMPGEGWGHMFSCAWFCLKTKVSNDIAENKDDYVAIFDLGGEGCVFDNDGVVQGLTNVLGTVDTMQTVAGKKTVELSRLSVGTDGSLEVWVEAGNNGSNHSDCGKVKCTGAWIAKTDRELFAYYYDFLALYQFAGICKDRVLKRKINAALKKAYLCAKDLEHSCVSQARSILGEFYKEDKKSDYTVYAVGHAHLDLAWLWPLRETKRKAERTFSNALANLEKYPDYVFGASQPQQFEWIKERRPSLYERIKKAVADGRTEVQGGMWVEPDTNLPSGESLIRQCSYGKEFFKEEFGKDIDMLWVPDVFGYSGALPQILRGCGMKRFLTIKLSWNNVNKFPYKSFVWEGIDGSDVLVHMPPEGDYNSNGNPIAVTKAEKEDSEGDITKSSMMLFGIGDGGGGPGEYHVNMVKRCAELEGLPAVKQTQARDFFDKLEECKDSLPRYRGELYLEKHQGTYTTQSQIKRFNRKIENELQYTEWLCTQASLKGMDYPHDELDRIWKEVLLYQFHDILPGSSIGRVYKECYQRYPVLFEELKKICEKALSYLRCGDGMSVVNYSPFKAYGYKNIDGKCYYYDVLPYSQCRVTEKGNKHQGFDFADGFISNGILTVRFNKNGEIVSVEDLENGGYDCVKRTFNTLRVYTDMRLYPYNAWDIDSMYESKPSRKMKLTGHRTYIDGGAVVREQQFRYNKSTLTQKVVLSENSRAVVFENEADWHEKHKMLRADFYPENFADKVACDIQFGHIYRSAKTKTSIEKAQFEICAHKWVDVYKDGYGVGIINDCKYGHRVKNGKISLNLLRSTVYPDPDADRGKHRFVYALYPHREKTEDSRITEYAYNLNREVRVLPFCINVEKFDVVGDDVILDGVHIGKDGKIVLRLYESKGRQAKAAIDTSVKYVKSYEGDMLGNPQREVNIGNLDFRAFEIKTILLEI